MQLQIPDADRLDTRQVLEANIHRIRSIASVHETLSEHGFRLVDVKDVLERIMQTTASSMVAPEQDIRLVVYGEALNLPSRQATALTLVVNELVQKCSGTCLCGSGSRPGRGFAGHLAGSNHCVGQR
ncbi:MAG: hypothetical protein M5U34_20040 [Chloroflexi bacterium]|nr:hypothetical protein [Chloroflexota bacterium]